MGIKGNFKKFLQDNAKEAFEIVSIDNFREQTIALDVMGLVFTYMSIADDWLEMIENFFMRMIEHEIDLIVVFEGIAPTQKKQEQDERKKIKNEIRDKLHNLRVDFEIFKATGEPTELINELLKTLTKPTTPHPAVYKKIIEDTILCEIGVYDEEITLDDKCQLINNHLIKMEKQIRQISKKDLDKIKEMCEKYEILHIQAEGEAEHTCAWLCKNNFVVAVLSEDSDLIALQCPQILFRVKRNANSWLLLNFEKLLQILNLSVNQLVDWAILCGTDYNESIPRYGVVKTKNLIIECQNIETIMKKYESKINKEQFEKLKFEFCRKIFHLDKIISQNAQMIFQELFSEDQKLIRLYAQKKFKKKNKYNY